MQVKVTIQDWNKVNHNNVVYEQGALDHMFYDSDELEVPVLGIAVEGSSASFASRDVIGLANVYRSDDFEVTADLHINNEYVESLLREGKGGFGACAVGADVTTVDDVHTVHSCTLRHIGYTLNPAQNTSFEIVEENDYVQ